MFWLIFLIIFIAACIFIAGINVAQTDWFVEHGGGYVWRCPKKECTFYVKSNWFGPVHATRLKHEEALHV